MTSPLTEVLTGILRAVRQPTAANMATGFELGKLLSHKLLNEREFARCHEMIDPRVRHRPESVTLSQYSNAAAEFLDRCGSLSVVDSSRDLHLNEPSRLYEDRDFAVGKTIWQDAQGKSHVFTERWVRDGRTWYTRCTGFMTPGKVAS